VRGLVHFLAAGTVPVDTRGASVEGWGSGLRSPPLFDAYMPTSTKARENQLFMGTITRSRVGS
jgi:hypothetical protein